MPPLSTLVDEFNGSSLNTSIWTQISGSTVVSGGTATLNTFSEIQSGNYSFVDSSIIIDLTQFPASSRLSLIEPITGGGVVFFRYSTGTTAEAEIIYGSNTGGNGQTFTFNIATMRFVRIRSAANICYVETSPDRTTWTQRQSMSLMNTRAFWSNRGSMSFSMKVQGGGQLVVAGVNDTPVVPVANFSGSPTTGTRPLNVSFSDLSTGPGTSWLWSFGDGGTSTLQNPSHSYAAAGSYNVTLTTTNGLGSDGETKNNYIVVSPMTFVPVASGTLTFSGSVDRKYKAVRQASGTMTFSGSVFAIRKSDSSGVEKKTFMYKVYDEDNNFLGVWDDVIDEPNWSQELNTTGSAMTVYLARNSDSLVVSTETLLDNTGATIKDSNNFDILTSSESRNKVGPGSNVNHNYRVDIYAFYGELGAIQDNIGLDILDNEGNPIMGTIGAPNGIRRFSGFISEINVKYGSDENTEVQLMSYGYDLDEYVLDNSSGETTVAFNSTDPSNTVKTALDRFTAVATDSFTTYSTATIATTGTTPSYTFKVNTYKEVLDTAVKLAPSGWFYWVGLGDNLVRFRSKPTTPRHLFYLGKHIKNLNLRSYIGDSVNEVYFTGGGDPALYKRYTETPAAGTRHGLSRYSDNRVSLETSADILSEGEIEEKNKIQYRSTVEILDKQYDIESIELGDMIGFRNFDNDVDTLLMQVVALNYTPDVITLQLDTLPPSVPKRLEELRKSLNAQEVETVPIEPDV